MKTSDDNSYYLYMDKFVGWLLGSIAALLATAVCFLMNSIIVLQRGDRWGDPILIIGTAIGAVLSIVCVRLTISTARKVAHEIRGMNRELNASILNNKALSPVSPMGMSDLRAANEPLVAQITDLDERITKTLKGENGLGGINGDTWEIRSLLATIAYVNGGIIIGIASLFTLRVLWRFICWIIRSLLRQHSA